MDDPGSPLEWRHVAAGRAADIDTAVEQVIAALKRLAAATDDPLVVAAATGSVIDRLDAWLERALEGHLSSEEADEDLDPA